MSAHVESSVPPSAADRLERARAVFRAAQRALDAARDELLTAQASASWPPRVSGSRR